MAAGSLAALTLVLAAFTAVPGVVGAFHDDGVYVVTARALAEGDGYRIVSLPDAPPQTKYPPLFPALLSLAWRLAPFPGNVAALEAVSVIAGAAFVAAAYLYLVRFGYAERPEAAAGCAIAAVSPTFLLYAAMPLSEMPYAVALVGALWALERRLASDQNAIRDVALGALLALPSMVRVMGFVAPLAVGLGLVALRDVRRLPALLAGAALIVGPWALWTLAAPPSEAAYYSSYSGWFALVGGNGPAVIAKNAWWTLCGVGVLALDGVEPLLVGQPFFRVVSVVVAGGLLVVWLAREASSGRVLPATLWAYLLVVVAWPWPPERFLATLAPFLLGVIGAVAGRWLRRVPVVAVVLTGSLFAAGLARSVDCARFSRESGFPTHPRADRARAPAWRSYASVLSWVRTHTPPDAVVASALDPMVFLYTDRTGFRPFVGRPDALYYGADHPPLGTPDALLEGIVRGGAGWVVDLGIPLFAEDRHFRALLDELTARGALETTFVDPKDPRFRVLRVVPPDTAP